MEQPPPTDAFHRLSPPERVTVLDILRQETTGGFLLLLAAAAALVWANLGADSYDAVTKTVVGPAALNLDLSLATWAKDGLLAVFFLVVGLELKREFVTGELRNPREAVVPMVAAVGGMVVPAAVYLGVNVLGDGDTRGWAVPAATDIAFALAVLAVIGSSLPTTLRAFLLTLAVVDDLLAITIIAVEFTVDLQTWALLASFALVGVYAFLQQRRIGNLWLYIPLWVLTWVLMHESGVHATIAGVAVGLATRAKPDVGEDHSPAESFEHLIRPISAGFAVPVFALLAAGVTISGDSLVEVFVNPIGLGIVLGLVVGKIIGVSLGAWLAVRFTRAKLAPDIAWVDVVGVGALAGIGFTVALLIGSLAFEPDEALVDLAKTAVLVASLLAAVVAAAILLPRNAHYRARLRRKHEQSQG